MGTDTVDKDLIVSVAKGKGSIWAAGFGRAPEIGAGSREIADPDHLVTMLHKVIDPAALLGPQNWRRIRIGRNIYMGEVNAGRRALRWNYRGMGK